MHTLSSLVLLVMRRELHRPEAKDVNKNNPKDFSCTTDRRPIPAFWEEGTVTEMSLSARERLGADFTVCSRRDSAVGCCPGLAAYGESHNRRLTLPFRVRAYPCLGISLPALPGLIGFDWVTAC